MSVKDHVRENRLIYREFRFSDIRRMFELDSVCFTRSQAFDLEAFYYYLFVLPSASLVAETDEGKFAGFIIISEVVNGNWELVTIDVHPEWRRQGIGTKLLFEGLTLVEKENPSRIELHVQTDNYPAIELYKKFDFSVVKVLENYYNDSNDAYLMRKEYCL